MWYPSDLLIPYDIWVRTSKFEYSLSIPVHVRQIVIHVTDIHDEYS